MLPSACAKAGVVALTRSLAVEWARYGIRLNAIAPGPIPTEGAFSRLVPSPEIEAQQPGDRVSPPAASARPEELAELAAFLVSDASDWMRGEVVTLDGGEWLYGAGEFNQLLELPPEMWEKLKAARKGRRLRRSGRRSVRPALAALVLIAAVLPVAGHDFAFTEVLLVLKSDGTWQAELTVDCDALALGVSPSTDNAELKAILEGLSPAEFVGRVEQARETLARRVRVRFDGRRQAPTISFPGLDGQTEPGLVTVLGTTARLTGKIPEGAASVTFFASRALRPVRLTVLEQTTVRGAAWTLVAGEESPPYALDAAVPASPPDRAAVVLRHGVLGFEHILPRGLDHILFVVGLFLLSRRTGPLLWQITAFTVAHTLTLALSSLGVVTLPSRLVETLIALSIAYVAIENLITDELKPWRPAVVFAFGLLHGLGFADALSALGLPAGEFVPALLAFNIGVELGQLCVVLLCLLVVGGLRNKPWYRERITVPASALIGVIGLWWALSRGLGLG